MNLTPFLNETNSEFVRNMINKKKNYDLPVYATDNDAQQVITDMDNFPYNRFFRGVYYFPNPVIMEREAGWRPVNNSCYRLNRLVSKPDYPNHCFEAPCNTTYPCYPKYVRKYDDKDSLDVQLNNTCTLQYR